MDNTNNDNECLYIVWVGKFWYRFVGEKQRANRQKNEKK